MLDRIPLLKPCPQPRSRVLSCFVIVLVANACGAITDQDASAKTVEWFEAELGRIGYVRGANGEWAISPRKVTVAIQGDALEAQIKGVVVTGVRPETIDPKAQDVGVTWRGQVYLRYVSRERFWNGSVARDWSEWREVSSIANVERRNAQWYVQRVR